MRVLSLKLISTMKLMKCFFCVLASCLCQALQDLDPEKEGHRFLSKTNGNLSEFNDESNGSVRVVHHAGTCTWSLEAGAGNQSVVLPLGRESSLLDRVCVDLGCGRAYNVTKSDRAGACLTGCSYRDRRLYNCTEDGGGSGGCLGASHVVCDPLLARLAGGVHRCGGRVELWAGGAWGTVCDDRWDLADGHVVCRQLGCGYAVEVSGQAGRFPPGAAGGTVLLDELMCTGEESSLWACPVAPGGGHHDCGHKEDAGVVCSEMRAVRLTGGADRCAGRVEVHVNGTWGTVCDTCWDRQAAAMACSMLGCGAEPQQYTQFDPPLGHARGGPRWYYMCAVEHTTLWQCQEFVNVPHICKGSKAAGLVCAGSKGFLTVSTPRSTASGTGLTTALAAGNTTGSAWDHFLLSVSPERIGCVALSVLLLVLLTAYCILCFQCRRRRDALALQQRSQQQEKSFNDYRESVSLVQVSSGPSRTPALPESSATRTQCSSRDCYEQPCHPPAFHMSTFNNSQRRWRGQSSPQAGSAVNTLYRQTTRNHDDKTIKHQSLNPSADSFDSSTSSEEDSRCYEDQKEDRVPADPNQLGGLYMDFEDPPFPLPTSSHQQWTIERAAAMLDPGYGGGGGDEDDQVYSPVSPDSCSSASDDYDDVAHLS